MKPAATADASPGAASRSAAARVVHRVLAAGRNLDDALAEGKSALTPRAHAELQAWSYGTLRWWPRIERQLAALSARPLVEIDPLVLALLAVALFQIQHSPIPAHAIVDESVAATALIGCARASGFVNALLRRYLRERAAIDTGALAQPVGRYAHPGWLIDRLRKDWPDDCERILDAGNEPPPLWLRVNLRRLSVEAALESLAAAGLAAERAGRISTAVRLLEAVPVDAIPGFASGALSVQDAGAQLAAPLLDARAGQRVLDACAAPGGKTCHIAEHTPGLGELVAIDKDARRTDLIRANLDRLGLMANVSTADALSPDEWWDGKPFDRILLDAPCSATGVIRRHPDIKVLRRARDIDAFALLQSRLLASLWPLLAAGGRLLYATCSILPRENSVVVADFLARNAGAALAAPHPAAAGLGRLRRDEPGLYLISGEAGTDGFYYACLEKTTAVAEPTNG